MTAGPISVVIPTFRRPEQLLDCLGGVASQERPADEVIVVVRSVGDDETHAALASAPIAVRPVAVDRPGQVAAMQAGADAAAGAVIAFTDDDAVPRPDWLAALARHFEDGSVGVVGGRDEIPNAPPAPRGPVGVVTAWGKLHGNQSYGSGPAREVDVVKGVNMAYRKEALALPEGLRGAGAQVHNEVATCLRARSMGWRIVYDPSIVVDHYPGPRFDADQRNRPAPSAISDEAYNIVMAVCASRPHLWWRRAAYGLLIGDRATPGVGRAVAAIVLRQGGVAGRLGPSLRGQLDGLRDARRHPLVLRPVTSS